MKELIKVVEDKIKNFDSLSEGNKNLFLEEVLILCVEFKKLLLFNENELEELLNKMKDNLLQNQKTFDKLNLKTEKPFIN